MNPHQETKDKHGTAVLRAASRLRFMFVGKWQKESAITSVPSILMAKLKSRFDPLRALMYDNGLENYYVIIDSIPWSEQLTSFQCYSWNIDRRKESYQATIPLFSLMFNRVSFLLSN